MRPAARTALPANRQWTLQNSSGRLCGDDLHPGHRTRLLATDPLGDFPVAFALGSANDQGHRRRVPNTLKTRAFSPHVVVTDGSNRSPAVRRAALVRDAGHQADPDLAKALAMPSAEKSAKVAAYLHRPAAERVRSNHHVERTNRRLRPVEKVRDKWRRRRTIVRFVILAVQRGHHRRIAGESQDDGPDRRASTPEARKSAG